MLLAALLRFYRLSHQSLWADEGNSVALARRGFAEIAQRTAFDIHPPLYYWLLKIWIAIFGSTEAGLRSLSVVLGVALVFVIWLLGRYLFSARVGAIAAFIAALSPLQVYYAQEARMYMLLALLGSLTVLVTLLTSKEYTHHKSRSTFHVPRIAYYVLRNPVLSLAYILTVTAGLYTHYAYPVILLVVNLTAIIYFIYNSQFTVRNSQLIHWLLLQLIPLLLYLPWLPIAWRQVTTWPSERHVDTLSGVLGSIATTLLLGLSWPYNFEGLAAIILGIVLAAGLWQVSGFRVQVSGFRVQGSSSSAHIPHPTSRNTQYSSLLTLLWLLLPTLLTILIFSPAFLKFLLVATPPLALLLALVISQVVAALRYRWAGYLGGGAMLAAIAGLSLLSLYHYYTNPTFARDNYRAIVQFISAVGGPKDAVILNAEGQQDVFNYYYQRESQLNAPVYPLPRQRPLDKAGTLAQLQTIAGTSNNVYAVYWAAHQADPTGLIEGWLNSHLFKATDQWYGNVRLVSYASPRAGNKLAMIPVGYKFGENIQLTGYGLSEERVLPGDILQVALQWQTAQPLAQAYTLFLQLLDPANHLVGQRDAQPLTPTSEWPVGEPVRDAHGIFIEPGSPPGPHRLVVGLYNNQTGQRLPVTAGADSQGGGQPDFVELAQLEVVRPTQPLPPEALDMQVPVNKSLGGVKLLGYSLYKLGHRSTPDTPLHPGDPLHVVAYWQREASAQTPADRLIIGVVKNSGADMQNKVTAQLAGINYPVDRWQPGQIVRAQYDIFLHNLSVGSYRLALEVAGQRVLTRPFQVQ